MQSSPDRWEMLWRTEDVLQSRGVGAEVKFRLQRDQKNITTSIHRVVAAGTINMTKRKAGRDWKCARNAEMRKRLPTASSRICLKRRNLSNLGHPEIFDRDTPS